VPLAGRREITGSEIKPRKKGVEVFLRFGFISHYPTLI